MSRMECDVSRAEIPLLHPSPYELLPAKLSPASPQSQPASRAEKGISQRLFAVIFPHELARGVEVDTRHEVAGGFPGT